jgi:hypothetical protein
MPLRQSGMLRGSEVVSPATCGNGNFSTFHHSVLLLSYGKHRKSFGKSPFSMGKSTISMVMFNSYVSLPEGTCLE